ncbi:EamA family transporter [Vagococcus intermedius]|uniref:EamA family transporter n=2 Tax=Vagococcus intermedius TaxID=2991418 RepID=A0AAF0CWR7_9ENTE|nr:EamA family transporter [Vagococcus intermedius]WEG74292.1 EamA family transporter [Vagococcus intermedius]
MYVVSFLLWMIIISKNDVSKIVPIGLGATNILIMFLSYFLLGESISMIQLIGVVTVIAGVILMNI